MDAARTFQHGRLTTDGVTILAAAIPPGPSTFQSERVQALYADVSESWSDPAPHAHSDSDEIFIVLSGSIVFDVDGVEVTVQAGEFACFPVGLRHAVLRSNPPTRHLVVRSPSVADKTYG